MVQWVQLKSSDAAVQACAIQFADAELTTLGPRVSDPNRSSTPFTPASSRTGQLVPSRQVRYGRTRKPTMPKIRLM